MIGPLVLTLLAAAAIVGEDSILTDERDGETYRTVVIGEQRWMAENLRTQTAASRCYANLVAHCLRFGRLYGFDDAQGACPAGWRLPSDEDWMRLEQAIGMPTAMLGQDRHRGAEDRLGERLKLGGGTGFDAPYAGYWDPHRREFRRQGEAAAYWTTTLDGSDDVSPLAWHRDLNVQRAGIWRSKVNITYQLAVRCLDDQAPRRFLAARK